jgi:hypothetical protein
MSQKLADGNRIKVKVNILDQPFSFHLIFHRAMKLTNTLKDVNISKDIRQLMDKRLVTDLGEMSMGETKTIIALETYQYIS